MAEAADRLVETESDGPRPEEEGAARQQCCTSSLGLRVATMVGALGALSLVTVIFSSQDLEPQKHLRAGNVTETEELSTTPDWITKTIKNYGQVVKNALNRQGYAGVGQVQSWTDQFSGPSEAIPFYYCGDACQSDQV